MEDLRLAVVGVGATGAVLAAALTSEQPDTLLVDPSPGLQAALTAGGMRISGALSFQVAVKRLLPRIADLAAERPDVLFLATKTFHLPGVLKELEAVFEPGMKLVSTHNGLGTEDLIAERFGAESAFRMSLNYGVALKAPGVVEAAFFNRPNHLGGLTAAGRGIGEQLAAVLTRAGLETLFVDDIKLFVWKKMIMKCTLASICAVTDRTIKEALDFPPTREIADACFREALAVAKAMGYDLGGEAYLAQALGYLEKVGAHKDSMCADIANRTPTEIDFLGGKVVEYGRRKGVATPFYITMTNLVKAMEDAYRKS